MSNSVCPSRLPGPSLSPEVCSTSCPLSPWYYPTISSSVIPFFSCLPSFPALGSFPVSQLFTSRSQSTAAAASALVLPVNIQGWFPLGSTGLILLYRGLSRVFSSTTIRNHQFFNPYSTLYIMVQLSHLYMTTGKTTALTRWTSVSKVMSLLFNTLSKFVMASLPRSKCLLIMWLQSPSSLILKPQKRISVSFQFFPIYLPWSDETRCHDLSFLNV